MGQLSFWSADARPRGLCDLEGLLCGPGQVELFGRGTAARLVVVLGSPPEAAHEEADEESDEEPDDEPDDEPGDEPDDGFRDGPGAEGPDEAPDDQARPDPAPDPDPNVDLDDLAFLDLDPDELAARLGVASPPASRLAGVSPPRGGGAPGVRPRHGRRADPAVRRAVAPAPPEDPVVRWRADAVCCALRVRGVPAQVGRAEDGRPEVRTAFRTDLAELARAWTTDRGMKTAPPGFELDGPRLRLWVLAAGAHEGRAYTLGLDPVARDLDDVLLTASRRAGLGATLAGDDRPPGLRIVGARRQGRLGELVGCPPRDLAEGIWPV